MVEIVKADRRQAGVLYMALERSRERPRQDWSAVLAAENKLVPVRKGAG
jgi:hypothetical protein